MIANSKNEIPINKEGLKHRTGFVENKGQIIDQNNNPNPSVLYLLNTPGMNVQLRNSGFSYDLMQADKDFSDSLKILSFSRIDFNFKEINTEFKIITSEKINTRFNYYTAGTPEQGILGVSAYKKIVYHNLYPGIDLEFLFDKEHGFKYNFIISPDGDINKIRFKISGATVEDVSDSVIILKTKFGILKELLPESFIFTNSTKLPGSVKFVEYGDSLIGFSAPSDGNIIIDPVPQRLWATYFGGTGFDGLNSLSLDGSGNIYSAGSTTSPTNIATSGSYQEVFMGAYDAFICKFSPSGDLIWATYYGGTNSDYFSDVFLTNDNKLVLAGSTSSPSNISTPGAYQTILTGPTFNDAMLVKFDTSGFRIWGTYFGGTHIDVGKSCIADQSGNIYLWGITRSGDGIATPGSFQPSFAGGTWDCYLAKFTSDGSSRLWSTYYGGSGLEELPSSKSISILNDSIYVLGNTYSTSGISSPGSFQPNLSGIDDVFFAKFSSNGNRMWGSYFGGPDVESAGGIKCGSNSVFICGRTFSASNIASPGCFQPSLAGSSDAFLATFISNGIRQWSTYFGGTEGDTFQGIDEDAYGSLYVTGFSGSLSGIATPDAFQENYSGGVSDGIIIKFDSSGNRIWGTYYGGEGHDYLTNAVCLQPFLYVSGNGNSAIGISTTGSYQELPGGSDDGYLIKFNICPVPENSGPISGANSICVPGTGFIYSIPAIPSAAGYHWTVPQGATIISGNNSNSITVDFSSSAVSGIISVYGTNSCGSGDSSFIPVAIIPTEIINVSISASNNNVCAGTSVTFTATPTNPGTTPTYQWKVNGVNSGTNSTSFIYTPLNNDVVTCELTSSLTVCISNNPATSNSITMVVNPNMAVSVTISASANPICSGVAVTFTANPTNGGSTPAYQWKVNGTPVEANLPTFTYIPLSGDGVTCTVNSSATCAINNPATSPVITMTVNPNLLVTISILSSSNPFCAGSAVNFTATPGNGGPSPSYQWIVNGTNAGTNSPVFAYNPSNNDSVRCVMTSNLNCVTSNPASSGKIIMIGLLVPNVSFTTCFDTVTILSAKPVKLKGGIPLGGTYSGAGVNSMTGIFTPSLAGIGLKTIQYTYTNVNSCGDGKSKTILVLANPAFTCGNTFTDIRDGKSYPTVQIGTQCWMAANLNYGSTVPSFQVQYDNCISEKYCYNDLTGNCNKYGGLYQWDEVMRYDNAAAGQGLCPPGWHVPAESEWTTLFGFYSGYALAGKPLQDFTNVFNALRSGVTYWNSGGSFIDLATIFWSSTSWGQFKILSYGMNSYNYSVSWYPASRANAFAVRCLRD
ncbi:MAG: FISUMP domain-containing protein [Bacteroidales bacterium]|nr:FISUMP domain-containing protein [Bacteroidales bacterium]